MGKNCGGERVGCTLGLHMAYPIADSPPTTLKPFAGPADTVRTMIELCVGRRGEQSTLVRGLKDHIIRWVQPKDYLSELLAVRNYAAEKCKYSNDALSVEQVQDPQRIAEQIIRYGRAVCDCDDTSCFIGALTRQLGRETQFVIVGFGATGQYSHVFTRAKEPKTGIWIVLDPVAGTDEEGMLSRVTTHQIWDIP